MKNQKLLRKLVADREKMDLIMQMEQILLLVCEKEKEIQALQAQMKSYEIDSLTGLLSRQHGIVEISTYLQSKGDAKGALLLIDFDNFKKLNDMYSHDVGDEFLKRFGAFLSDSFPDDIALRWGGDEFILFIKDFESEAKLDSLCLSLIDGFNRKVLWHARKVGLSLSIGCATYPAQGSNFMQLFIKADEALKYAKNSGKNQYVKYTPDLRSINQELIDIRDIEQLLYQIKEGLGPAMELHLAVEGEIISRFMVGDTIFICQLVYDIIQGILQSGPWISRLNMVYSQSLSKDHGKILNCINMDFYGDNLGALNYDKNLIDLYDRALDNAICISYELMPWGISIRLKFSLAYIGE